MPMDFDAAFGLAPSAAPAPARPDFDAAFGLSQPAAQASPQPEGGPPSTFPQGRAGVGDTVSVLNNRMLRRFLMEKIDAIRGIPASANQTLSDASVPPGLRRNDVTDIPVNPGPSFIRGVNKSTAGSQPTDPLVGDATQIAASALTPSAGRLVGTTEAGILGEGGGRITARPDSIMPDKAARLIAKKFAEDKIAPSDVAQGALDQAKIGATGTLPLDLGGDSVRRLAGSTYRTGKEAGQTIASRLDERAAGQGERIGKTITESLADPSIAYKTADDISKARAEAAAPLYQKAYEEGDRPVWSPTLERLSSSPTVQQAMQGAVRVWRDNAIADGYGGAMNPGAMVENGRQLKFLNGKVPVNPNIQFWDYTKRILDDQIGGAVRAGENQKARTLTTLSKALRNELDTQVPAYAEARAAYAGPSQNLDAIESGMAAINKPHEVVASEIADLPDAAKDMYRLGFARSLQAKKLDSTGDVTAGLTKPEFVKRMQAVYPNAESFQRTQNHILSEQQQMRNRYEVAGNSKTAQRIKDDMQPDVGGLIDKGIELVTSPVKGALKMGRQAATDYVNKRLGLNDPKLAAEVADMLTTRISDPEKFGQVMRRVQDEYKRIKK